MLMEMLVLDQNFMPTLELGSMDGMKISGSNVCLGGSAIPLLRPESRARLALPDTSNIGRPHKKIFGIPISDIRATVVGFAGV